MNDFLIPIEFSLKDQEHIQILHQALTALNYTINATEISNKTYGSSTKMSIQSFQSDRGLNLSNILNSETIQLLNEALETLYKVCGTITNDYGMPIEGVTVTVSETTYSGSKITRGTGVSLQNGSYRVYLTIPQSSLTIKGALKNNMCVTVDLTQDGVVLISEKNLFVQSTESVFNFSSGQFIYKGESIYKKLTTALSSHGLNLGALASMLPSELVNVSVATGISMEMLMKLVFAFLEGEKLFYPTDFVGKAEIAFAYIYQHMPVNMPQQLFHEELPEYGASKWEAYKTKIVDLIFIGLLQVPYDSLVNILWNACQRSIIDKHDYTWVTGKVNLIEAKKNDTLSAYPLLEGDVSLATIITAAKTTLTAAQKIEIVRLFVDHINDFKAFLDALNQSRTKYGSANIDLLVRCFEISRIARNYEPLITKLQTKYSTELTGYGTRYLATFSKGTWEEILRESLESGGTSDPGGGTGDPKDPTDPGEPIDPFDPPKDDPKDPGKEEEPGGPLDPNIPIGDKETAMYQQTSSTQEGAGAIVGCPADFTIPDYAGFLFENAQLLYPDMSAAAQMAEMQMTGSPKFTYAKDIRELLLEKRNANILTDNVETILAGHWRAQNPAFVERFKTVQRVLRITPSAQAAICLLEQDIMAAGQVYSMGKPALEIKLKDQLSSGLVSQTDIDHVFALSTARVSNALMAFASLHQEVNKTNPRLVSAHDAQAIKDELQDEFPNIEYLFGSNDFCECDHDASVYSPAAYLADLLDFLTQRNESEETPQSGLKGIDNFLKNKRPDIANIPLNEHNTNTMLPYIDLVCEILEDAAIQSIVPATEPDPAHPTVTNPGKPTEKYKRDASTCKTTWTTGELSAMPEHLLTYGDKNDAGKVKTAYDVIKDSVYPMFSSFNLHQAESRAYLNKMGIARHELMAEFQKGINPPSNASIAAEYFGLTTKEEQLITANTGFNTDTLKKIWRNLPANVSAGDMPVPAFMADSALSFKEVTDLVHAQWNKLSNLALTDDCSSTEMNVTSSHNGFDRTQRFIRLWRKSGWKIWELNLLLNQPNTVTNYTGPNTDNLDQNTLYLLYHFHKQQKELGLGTEELLTLYGNINRTDLYENGEKHPSLYDKLFLSKTFFESVSSPLKTIKSNPSQTIDENNAELVAYIASCLSMSLTDYDLLAKFYDFQPNTGPKGPSSAKPRDFYFLSYLHCNTVLAKALQLTIPELISFLKSNHITNPGAIYDMGTVNRYIDQAKTLKASKLGIYDYEYLVQYGYDVTGLSDPASQLALTEPAFDEIMAKLKAESGEYPQMPYINSQDIEPTGIPGADYVASPGYRETFHDYLATMKQFEEEDVRDEFIQIIEGSTKKSPKEVDAWISNVVPELSGTITPPDTISAPWLLERYNEVIHVVKTKQEATRNLLDYMAEAFDLPAPVAELLLIRFRIGDGSLLDWMLEKSMHENEPDVVRKWVVFLHKSAFLIHKLSMSYEELTKFLNCQDRINCNWFKFKACQADTDADTLSLSQVMKVCELMRLHKQYVPPAKEESFLSMIGRIENLAMTPTSYFYGKMCLATGWDLTALKDLAGAQGLNLKYKDFLNPATYAQIECCLAMIQKANVAAASVAAWKIREGADEAAQALSIKKAARALSDADSWLKEMPDFQKPLREAKTDALASYLVAYAQRKQWQSNYAYLSQHPDIAWNDKADLYNYFMLDPEMSADMKTSRIVQATNAIQLFVQRCFLNLEKYITCDEKQWKQWDWIKRYRLWEANRKVFLYPENWIEPELRDDKSPFFKELEEELEQSDITPALAETVFENYLHKLHEVSNLTVCGFYREQQNDGTDKLHVVARTKATPYQFFYRSYDNKASHWSNWEAVDLDIKGDVVVPMVYNRRLHLFWLSVTEKTHNNSSQYGAKEPDNYSEIQLGWSSLRGKKWIKAKYSHKKHIQHGHRPVTDYSLVARQDRNKNELVFNVSSYFYENKSVNNLCSCNTDLGVFYFNGDVYKSESSIYFFPTTGDGELNQLYLDLENPSADKEVINNSIESLKKELQKPKRDLFETLAGKIDADARPELNFEESCYWPGKTWMRSSRLYPMYKKSVAWHDVEWQIYMHDDEMRLLFSTANENPNLVLMMHDYERMAIPLWHAHWDHPFFYQDAKRSFFVQRGLTENDEDVHEFYPSSHPYANLFIQELNRYGINGILNRDIQLQNSDRYKATRFEGDYHRYSSSFNSPPFYSKISFEGGCKGYTDMVDFDSAGAYSAYNWELFFHAPLYIACKLSQNQKYEEAMQWFHYIFDPTNKALAEGDTGESAKKFWITKPFYHFSDPHKRAQQIREILKNLDAWRVDVENWANNPFNPHLIARARLMAYQKAVVMKYVDNLIAWADQLFRQDTMESTNEAALLYVLAYEILGKRPIMLPGSTSSTEKCYTDIKGERKGGGFRYLEEYDRSITYNYTENPCMLGLAKPENSSSSRYSQSSHYALTQPENAADGPAPVTTVQSSVARPTVAQSYALSGALTVQNQLIRVPQGAAAADSPTLPDFHTDTFCIPHNEQLIRYWDLVEDRLFKLRHCMNIDGIVRQLALFAPPIDPALLVRATAAGIDLDKILSDEWVDLPPYRYRTVMQKAVEFTGEVKQLGEKFLSILEKRDAETLSLLRNTQEINLQKAMKQMRKIQIDEAKKNIETLEASIRTTEARKAFYENRELMNALETNAYQLNEKSKRLSEVIAGGYSASAIVSLIPNILLGGAGMASPLAGAIKGGQSLSENINATMAALSQISQTLDKNASLLLTKSGYERRKEDWDFQAKLAGLEIEQLDKQVIIAEIRLMLAEKELESMELQMEQSEAVKTYYEEKFTNRELYNWMISQISVTYLDAYKLAYGMAKMAEKCFRAELPEQEEKAAYIRFGNWDSLKKGLLSGDLLMHQLHQMDDAYIRFNKRKLELTKHISLAQLFPANLIELVSTKKTLVDLEEYLFDMDYPGHYMRSIKSVSVTIPNVSGPNTTVSFMLKLNSSKKRTTAILEDEYEWFGYRETPIGEDPRFTYQTGSGELICTSSAQNDAGLFELNFGDERYLPFENAGAASQWELSFPAACNQFDLTTVSDVILHLNYTALYSGDEGLIESVQDVITEDLPTYGRMLFSLKQDFPDAWNEMLVNHRDYMEIEIRNEQLPFFLRHRTDLKAAFGAAVLVSKVGGQSLAPQLMFNGQTLSPLEEETEYGDGFLYHTHAEEAAGLELYIPATGQWKVYIRGFNPPDIEDLWVGFNLAGGYTEAS